LNYGVPKTRQYILDTLVNGLQRLEYRGYDSAGKLDRVIFFAFVLRKVCQTKIFHKIMLVYCIIIKNKNVLMS